MIDLRNIETFVLVARLGVFRRAAEELNTTQPAISARIALLERDLGVKLFDRRPRRVALTPSGVELLGYAERLLSLRSEMVQAIGGATSYKGALRIGVPETIVHTWFALLVERIAEDFPSLTLDIEVDSTVNLRQALAAERLDIAITHGPSMDGTLRSELLCSFPLAWAGRADLGFPDGPLSLADLARLPIVTFRRGSPPYAAVRGILDSNGLIEARIFGSSSIAGTVRMAIDGIGSCVLPPAVLQKELQDGRLRLLQIEHALPTLDFYVNFPRESRLHLARVVADLAILISKAYLQDLKLRSKNFISEIETED